MSLILLGSSVSMEHKAAHMTVSANPVSGGHTDASWSMYVNGITRHMSPVAVVYPW